MHALPIGIPCIEPSPVFHTFCRKPIYYRGGLPRPHVFASGIFICRIFIFCVAVKRWTVVSTDKVFLSLDCGSTEGYKDSSLEIRWESDAAYITRGTVATIDATYNNSHLPRRLTTLRYFPFPKKNCYHLPSLVKSSKYLVRASFFYGNYDGKSSPPKFALQFDGNRWDDVVTSVDKESVYELIYSVKVNNASVCVAQTSADQIPFISSLEVRSMDFLMYSVESVEDVLFTKVRTAFGLPEVVRHPSDPYDRIWYPNAPIPELASVTSESKTFEKSPAVDNPPAAVLLHAVTPSSKNATSMTIPSTLQSTTTLGIYYNLYYAEVSNSVAVNKNRSFDFFIDDQKLSPIPIIPPFEGVPERNLPSYDRSSATVLKWMNSPGATVPPLLNALEFYENRHGLFQGTLAGDVGGLKLLQDRYSQLQPWNGDPCLPPGFTWEWINCNADDQPRVNALTLSGYNLNDPLPDFSTLQALEKIDLSNNSLSGGIPEFFGNLPKLMELNLAFNNFSGEVPYSLTHKQNLKLNTTGNPGLSDGHKKDDHKKLVIFVATTISIVVILLLISIGVVTNVYRPKEDRRKRGILQSQTDRAFSYQEIVEITKNFSQTIGRGGSGTVFRGQLKDKITEVAVKVLSERSREFVAEVKLLMKIHHRHLVSFFGFCEEDNHMVVLYEYMANGNLGELLHGNKPLVQALTWKKRMEIARDVAAGLQYLHSGCQPSIIHRDVKSTNILLNEQLDAKLADFGISRTGFTLHEVGYLSTNVAGTPGYMDPEYSETNLLTEKSDVYSFGVVLFELISGHPAIFGPQSNRVHIVSWARTNLETSDINSIVDPRLKGKMETESLSTVTAIAMKCTEHNSTERPKMDDVLSQVNELVDTRVQDSALSPVVPWELGGDSANNTEY